MKKNKIDIKTEDEVIDQTFHNDTQTGDNTFDGFTDESTNNNTKEENNFHRNEENNFHRNEENNEINILKHNKKVINEAFDNLLDKDTMDNFETYTIKKNTLYILEEEKRKVFENRLVHFIGIVFFTMMILIAISSVMGIYQFLTK